MQKGTMLCGFVPFFLERWKRLDVLSKTRGGRESVPGIPRQAGRGLYLSRSGGIFMEFVYYA